MLGVIALVFAFLISCGGGGGGGSGSESGGAVYPELQIFFHSSETPVPPLCDETVYDIGLYARCIYRDRVLGREEVNDFPTDYISEPPACVEGGHLRVYKLFTALSDPSAFCPSFPDKDLIGSLWVIYNSDFSFSSPYFGEDVVTLDPITTLASYPYRWWGSDLTNGASARNRMDVLSQYAGFPSYPPITGSSDHESFMTQVKTNLGLPSDAPKELVMNALMEKRLQLRGISFGEYFSSLPDTSAPVRERSFGEREESAFPFASYCSPADNFACPLGDLCTATNDMTFDCLKFHSGKLALRIYYDTSNEKFLYCFYALDERTGKYFFVGECTGLDFEVPSLQLDEFVQSYSKLYCEDSGIPFTIRCYAELTTTKGRTLAVSNHFTFDLARY